MPKKQADAWKDERLKEWFPEMSEEGRERMKTFLDDYAELILRIFDRMERDGSLRTLSEQKEGLGDGSEST